MTSNNDSRKRRRVTFEDDAEDTSGRGRQDNRDKEEDNGHSSDQMNTYLGSGVREDNEAGRHVGEVTGDDLGSRRSEDGGLDGPSCQPPSVACHGRRDAHDGSERAGGSGAGRTRDGQQSSHMNRGESASLDLPLGLLSGPGSRVYSYIRQSASALVLNGECKVEQDAATHAITDVSMVGSHGAPDIDSQLGPYGEGWPLGASTAIKVCMLFDGQISSPDALDDFIACNIALEIAQSKSPIRRVWSLHTSVKGPQPLTCGICHHDGTHSTGRCAMVTSEKHGDTNTDPFCGFSCDRAQDRHGNPTHGLQRRRDSIASSVQVTCTKLAAHWEKGELGLLFQKFVVERRRMAPLLVYTKDFCFIRLAIAYSGVFCRGEMPEALEGLWPYTKEDAMRYSNQLRQFYEIGMHNMPTGELEGLTMADIRARYDTSGGIPPQYRCQL